MASNASANALRSTRAHRRAEARSRARVWRARAATWLFGPVCLALCVFTLSLPLAAQDQDPSLVGHPGTPEAELDAEADPDLCRPEAPTEPWVVDPALSDDVAELLGDKERFRFCHEEGYQLWPHEKSTYCQDSERLASRCPELPRACQRPAFGAQEDSTWDLDLDFDWLAVFAQVARVLFWIVLAAGLALLLRALVRNLAEERARRRRKLELTPVLVEQAAELPDAPKETDVQRLLARARGEAAEGDFASAMSSAYAAALRALQQRRLLELHRSRTNGDYLRQLGPHPAERERLREIVREVETVQFGRGTADAPRFEHVMQRVATLVGQAASVLLLVVGALSTTGCDDGPRPDPAGSAHGPDGYALLEGLLQRHSGSAQRRVRRLTGDLEEVAAFVALGPQLRDEEWTLLMDWVATGGTLFAAGIPRPLGQYLEHNHEIADCTAPLTAPGLELAQSGARAFTRFPKARTLVHCGDAPFLVAMNYGDGQIYALPSAAWLRNANLAAVDNAQVVIQLAAAPGGRVELLGPWTGAGTQHPFESLHNAGLTPWLLQLLVLALAYAIARGVRFRTPVEPLREQRRAFAEHAEALAHQYARGKASGYALEQYGRWAIERIRERVPVRERDLHALAHAVARRTGGEPMSILKLLVEAQSAGQVQGAPEDHLRTMEALSRILRDVGGA